MATFKIFTNSMNTSDVKSFTSPATFTFTESGHLEVTDAASKVITYAPHAWHHVEETP